MSPKLGFFCAAAVSFALPVVGEETRELDAHEHGHGALNIAFDGDQIAMELEAPGFDIVGFEYEAESESDLTAIETALATLSDPLKIVTLPDNAGCTATMVAAELLSEDEHDDHEEHAEGDDHDHEEHAEGDDHDHEEHAEGDDHDHEEHAEGDDHDHEEHAEGDEHDHEEHAEGDDHDHEKHAEGDEHDHEEHAAHDHDDHDDEESHTEFHVEYLFTCSDTAAVTKIDLPYFSMFSNAEELTVQVATANGAALLEATPDAPTLDLTKAQ